MANKNLVWLRNDLRIKDNPALFKSQQNGKTSVVFITTIGQWEKHHASNASLGLRFDVLKNLAKSLGELGIEFKIIESDLFKNIPQTLKSYCTANKVTNVWFNMETPFDENKRDQAVIKQLNGHGINVHAEPYDMLVSQPVFNLSAKPFKVFTAYYNKWLDMLQNQNNSIFAKPSKQGDAIDNTCEILENHQYDYRKDIWPCDIDKIESRLISFCEAKIDRYNEDRDFPNKPGTSVLSPYLAMGMLGPRFCLDSIQKTYKKPPKNAMKTWQKDAWLRELAWRDYYRQLMVHFPYLSKNKNFKSKLDNMPWRKDFDSFDSWCQGQTGFPIVDAAMRQLNQTGWMHNRMRMVTASFLTKLLFVDWRIGEKYFMKNLIDGEFSANNGGWQWSASTGCDSVPYFRVFNPTLQSEKFDKGGEYIRKFVPELSSLTGKDIHKPSEKQRIECGYSLPIIDYKKARIRAIEVFKANN